MSRLRALAAEPIFRLAFLVGPSTRVAPSQIDPDGFVNFTPAQKVQHRLHTHGWRWRFHVRLCKLACKVGGFE